MKLEGDFFHSWLINVNKMPHPRQPRRPHHGPSPQSAAPLLGPPAAPGLAEPGRCGPQPLGVHRRLGDGKI